MARREKKESGGGGGAGWIVTFSDLMTLLLTFFVLLLSMSTMDQRKTRATIDSLATKFATDDRILFPPTPEYQPGSQKPGDMGRKPNDMSPLREVVSEDTSQDLDFQENHYIQTFSIQSEALFPPGSAELTASGVILLDRLLPVLSKLDYPLLIAGHSSPRKGEEGKVNQLSAEWSADDAPWLFSYLRALAVYRHFIGQGLDQKKLTLEAFGQFHPRFSSNTPEDRAKNRRVDLVLDRRNRKWAPKAEGAPQRETKDNGLEYLRLPGDPPPGARAPSGWRRR